jgi:hypothetical protein
LTPLEILTVFYLLEDINGSLISLSGERGFRNYVARRLTAVGVSGYIQRSPRTRANLIVIGTAEQHHEVQDFLDEIKTQNMIFDYFISTEKPAFLPARQRFVVAKSARRHVVTGTYSESTLDQVSTVSSRSERELLGSPSVHSEG